MLTTEFVDLASGVQCYFKAEHLQRTGSFKMRGAANVVYNPNPNPNPNLNPSPNPKQERPTRSSRFRVPRRAASWRTVPATVGSL